MCAPKTGHALDNARRQPRKLDPLSPVDGDDLEEHLGICIKRLGVEQAQRILLGAARRDECRDESYGDANGYEEEAPPGNIPSNTDCTGGGLDDIVGQALLSQPGHERVTYQCRILNRVPDDQNNSNYGQDPLHDYRMEVPVEVHERKGDSANGTRTIRGESIWKCSDGCQ